jgi:hypothetical protein
MRTLLIVCALAGALSLVAPAGADPGERSDVPLSIHHTLPIRTSDALARARSEARRVTARFLGALDQGKWELACSLLARQFYRSHHILDRKHCVAGFAVGMGGWAVKFKVLAVHAQVNRALVHVAVDGSPGTVELVREALGFRITAMRAD